MTSVKFKDLERFLIKQGATVKRDGKGSHQIWERGDKTAAVPRHRLISPGSLRDILRNLGINYKNVRI